jgi:hypothetical protein
MRIESAMSSVPGFTLVCPGYRSKRHAGASASVGRLAFAVDARLVAELDDGQLVESWAATQDLSPAEADEMSETAALHLIELLDEGLPTSGYDAAATDAALVFLLAMKRHGVADPRHIPACTVDWTLSRGLARVRLTD